VTEQSVTEQRGTHARWSDRKADTVAVLVIFAALLLGAIYFASGGA
jgi:hypothetical protein